MGAGWGVAGWRRAAFVGAMIDHASEGGQKVANYTQGVARSATASNRQSGSSGMLAGEGGFSGTGAREDGDCGMRTLAGGFVAYGFLDKDFEHRV